MVLSDYVAECKARISAGLCSKKNCPNCDRFWHMNELFQSLDTKTQHELDLESSKKADILYGIYGKRSTSGADWAAVILALIVLVVLIIL